jgi:spoIIIJ-associated protein
MRRIVEEGATVKEATDKALAALGVKAGDRYEVKVLEEPGRGFLGTTSRPARVEVTAEEPAAPASKAPPRETAPMAKEVLPPTLPWSTASPTARAEAAEVEPDDAGPDQYETPAAQSLADRPEPLSVSPAQEEEFAGHAVALVRELLEKLGYAHLEVRDLGPVERRQRLVSIEGEDAHALIGGRGIRLKASEHRLNLFCHVEGSRPVPVVLAVDGYRDARLRRLHAIAERSARQAQRTGRPLKLQPMDTADRKVIHEYLASRGGVSTSSEGREPSRRLVITPLVRMPRPSQGPPPGHHGRRPPPGYRGGPPPRRTGPPGPPRGAPPPRHGPARRMPSHG